MAPGKPASLFENTRYVYIKLSDFYVHNLDMAPDEVVTMMEDLAAVYDHQRKTYGPNAGHKAILVGPKVAEMLWPHVMGTFTPIKATGSYEVSGTECMSPALEELRNNLEAEKKKP